MLGWVVLIAWCVQSFTKFEEFRACKDLSMCVCVCVRDRIIYVCTFWCLVHGKHEHSWCVHTRYTVYRMWTLDLANVAALNAVVVASTPDSPTAEMLAGWLAGACVRLCASDAFMLLKFDSTRIRFTGCALPGRSSPFVVVPASHQLTHHRHRHRQAINKCVQEIACPVGGPRTSELHAEALCAVWRVHRHRAIKKTVYCVTFHNMCVAFLFCAVFRNGCH